MKRDISLMAELRLVLERNTPSVSNMDARFLSTLYKLEDHEVSWVAQILANRFPDVGIESVESSLPRVGELIGNGVMVRKVERRENKEGQPYWLVGMSGEKAITKTVFVEGDQFKVSWKSGSKWKQSDVPVIELRAELAKTRN